MPTTPPMHKTERRYIKGSDGNPIFTYASYGNFTFPAAISLKMSVEPVYESSGRIAKWWKHTFTVETVIDPTLNPQNDTGGTYPVDLNMSQVRRWLSIPGQSLVFWNLGIGQNQRLDYSAKSPTGFNSLSEPGSSTGDLKQDPKDSGDGSPSKNSSHYSFRVDNASDLNFGPKPQLLVCECIGGSRAYRIVWTVECALPSCCVVYTGSGFTLCDSPSHFNDGTYSIPSLSVLDTNLKVTEFNYSLSWSIDESRFTTFSIVGTIELAGTIFASYIDTASSTWTGAVMDTGEAMDALGRTFLLRPGFNRSMQYDLSRDKRRLDFRITDVEIPSDNPYYPGIKSCNMKQSVSGSPFKAKWNLNFNGDFEVQPGYAKYVGLVAFVSVLSERLREVSLATSTSLGTKQKGKAFKPFYFPTYWSFEEDIFSRRTSFDFSFHLIVTFDKVLEASKLFSNITNNTWLDHRNELSTQILDHKGTAQIRTLSHEPLVTVCRSPDVFYDVTQIWFKPFPGQQYSIFSTQCPDFKKSIIDIKFAVSQATKSSIAEQQTCVWLNPETYNRDAPQSFYKDENAGVITLPDWDTVKNKKITSLPSQAGQIQTIEENSSGQYGTSKLTKKTANVQYQTTGPSKNYIELRAVVTTWCHNIKGLEIREVLCYVEQGGPPQAVKPVIVEQSIQEFCEDERAAVPKKEFRVYTLFSVPGIVLGALRVNINGEDPKDTIEDILAKSAPGDNNGSGTKKDRTS